MNKLYNIDIIVAAIPLVIKEYADVRFVFSAHALDQEYFDLIMKNDYKDYIIIDPYDENYKNKFVILRDDLLHHSNIRGNTPLDKITNHLKKPMEQLSYL